MSDDLRRHLGDLLRELRASRGLTLEDVQDLTRQLDDVVSKSRLSMLERGETDLRIADVYALTRAYGCPVGDLFVEVIVAHGRGRFPESASPRELFEEGKRLFHVGCPLEAGWAFDEAGRRTDDGEEEFRFLCMLSAGHCYERAGYVELALRRVETVVDHEQLGQDNMIRSLAKLSVLYASRGAEGRTRILLATIEQARTAIAEASELQAYVDGACARALDLIGATDKALQASIRSASTYKLIGSHDMAAKQLAAASDCASQLGRKKDSIKFSRDASSLLRPDSEIETQIYVQLAAGNAHLEQNDVRSAERVFNEVARTSSDHGYVHEATIALDKLQRIAVAEGRTTEADRIRRKQRRVIRSTAGRSSLFDQKPGATDTTLPGDTP